MSDQNVVIHEADVTGDDLAYVKTLFVEYAEGLGFSLCFQGFDKELETLPGKYAKPRGNLWLAWVNGALAGCVGIRPYDKKRAEMKRLFVRPGFRGHRLGSRLTRTVVDHAREVGYKTVLLDTIEDRMREAQAIYRQAGFEKCDPYYKNPPKDIVFYALSLKNAPP